MGLMTRSLPSQEHARKALDVLWDKRQRGSDLVGTVINIHNGDWVRRGEDLPFSSPAVPLVVSACLSHWVSLVIAPFWYPVFSHGLQNQAALTVPALPSQIAVWGLVSTRTTNT